MQKRFVTIWFPYLETDRVTLTQKVLSAVPLVLSVMDHGRKRIAAVNPVAHAQGIRAGMVVADAKALLDNLVVLDHNDEATQQLLLRLAHWCIRFTPTVIPDAPAGLVLDATGCTHLWGGEEPYINHIIQRLNGFGLHARAAVADTIGAAWAVTRFGKTRVVPTGQQLNALCPLPAAALRIEEEVCRQLDKLGLRQVHHFIHMPRASLQRRFGEDCVRKIHFALGTEDELREALVVPEPWQERLPCIEPIVTRTGIEIGLQQLLAALCARLRNEGKGLRSAVFKGFRVDGKTVLLTIGTNKASHNETHLHKLFALKLESFEPGPGIELFVLEAPKVEDAVPLQTQLWGGAAGLQDDRLAELLDRVHARFGEGHFHRYLPAEHYWPERSVTATRSLTEKTNTPWTLDRPRPLQLLPQPETIEVTAPIPDYPPMNFRHKGKLHKVMRADGPERIEQEWWLQSGEHRDYYCVEDEEGQRYWVFRSGHYQAGAKAQWYLHGYFA